MQETDIAKQVDRLNRKKVPAKWGDNINETSDN